MLEQELLQDNFELRMTKYPMLSQKLDYYYLNHPELIQNKVINSFLNIDFNRAIFILSLYHNNNYKELLDQLFKEYYFEYRFLSYISKYLYFEAINFDKRRRKKEAREKAILYQSIEHIEDIEAKGSWRRLPDFFYLEHTTNFHFINKGKVLEYLSNEKLYSSFKKLTPRQQEILFYAYVRELKDVEIAKILNVSQQAISKARKLALNILRELMEVEENA